MILLFILEYTVDGHTTEFFWRSSSGIHCRELLNNKPYKTGQLHESALIEYF